MVLLLLLLQVASHHEDLLSQATGIETLESMLFHLPLACSVIFHVYWPT